jgi:hypothetical protein
MDLIETVRSDALFDVGIISLLIGVAAAACVLIASLKGSPGLLLTGIVMWIPGAILSVSWALRDGWLIAATVIVISPAAFAAGIMIRLIAVCTARDSSSTTAAVPRARS